MCCIQKETKKKKKHMKIGYEEDEFGTFACFDCISFTLIHTLHIQTKSYLSYYKMIY